MIAVFSRIGVLLTSIIAILTVTMGITTSLVIHDIIEPNIASIALLIMILFVTSDACATFHTNIMIKNTPDRISRSDY